MKHVCSCGYVWHIPEIDAALEAEIAAELGDDLDSDDLDEFDDADDIFHQEDET